MKIGKLEVKLAQQGSKQGTATPDKLDVQIGSGITSMDKYINKYYMDPKKLKAKDFVKMRKDDGTASALYNILTMPIIAADWTIEGDKDLDPTGEQAQFVLDSLTLPPERGGMSTPFHLVIADMLRAVSEGYRYFEKVHTLSPQEKIVYRKLVSYDSESVTILTDDKGGFAGAEQKVMNGTSMDTVKIPIEKSFLFTHNKERDWIYGESAFVAAYKHYLEKRKLYYLGNMQAQAAAIPARVGKAAEKSTQEQMDAVAASLSDLIELNSAVVLPFGYDVTAIGSTAKMDIMPLINHHNREMAISVLAHFLMLGDGASGSWALSKDQTDLFSLVIRSIMKNLEYHINAYIIPDLTEFNFAQPSYPTFKFAQVTDGAVSLVADAFKTVLEKYPEAVPDYVLEGIAGKMANQLGLDKPEGDAGEKHDIGSKAAAAAAQPAGTVQNSRSDARFLGSKRWVRSLRPSEERVNFDGLEKKYNSLTDDFKSQSEALWSQIEQDITGKLRPLLEAKDYAGAMDVKINKSTEYTKLISDNMNEAYTYAKNGASEELNLPTPPSPNVSRVLIKTEAKSYVEKQFADVEFNIRSAINESLRKNQLDRVELSVSDLVASISAMIIGYQTDNVEAGIGVALATAINLGRTDVFKKYDKQLDRYEYSAILDGNACQICADLDGTVVNSNDYFATKWNPPIHFNCRCLWVAIKADETEKPAITGFLETYGGVKMPTLTSPTFTFSKSIHRHYENEKAGAIINHKEKQDAQ